MYALLCRGVWEGQIQTHRAVSLPSEQHPSYLSCRSLSIDTCLAHCAALLPDGYIKSVVKTSRNLLHWVQGYSGLSGHHDSKHLRPLPCGAGAAAAHPEGQEEAGGLPAMVLSMPLQAACDICDAENIDQQPGNRATTLCVSFNASFVSCCVPPVQCAEAVP